MAGGHNRRGSGRAGRSRPTQLDAVRDDHSRPSLAGNAAHMPCPSRHPSVRPARSHSLPVERHLPGLMQRPSPPGVSLFWRFRCYLDLPPAPHGSLRHPPPPGVSLFWRFRCYLDLPPAPHGSLRHPPPPGVSLFWRFRCYLDRPPAPRGPLRHPPPPGVSRFRRIGSHLRRVTKVPGPALW